MSRFNEDYQRNGSEENFDVSKISAAVAKANKACEKGAISAEEIEDVADYVEYKCNKMNRAVSVEEIQDMVEISLWQRALLSWQEDM